MQNSPTPQFILHHIKLGVDYEATALYCHCSARVVYIHIMGRLAQGHHYYILGGRRPSFLVFPLLMVFFCTCQKTPLKNISVIHTNGLQKTISTA